MIAILDLAGYLVLSHAIAFLLGLYYCYSLRDSEVLFFPDSRLPCKTFYKQLNGYKYNCRFENCLYAHDRDNERTSLIKMLSTLNKAKRSIDLCVYDFSQFNLGEFLIQAKRRNIRVRVITDYHSERQPSEMAAVLGVSGNSEARDRSARADQIPRLQGEGIQIKAKRTSSREAPLMHNKFVLIDSEYVLTGSFNWTHAAVTRNEEAVIKTNERKIVVEFSRKFDEMWRKLDDLPPRSLY